MAEEQERQARLESGSLRQQLQAGTRLGPIASIALAEFAGSSKGGPGPGSWKLALELNLRHLKAYLSTFRGKAKSRTAHCRRTIRTCHPRWDVQIPHRRQCCFCSFSPGTGKAVSVFSLQCFNLVRSRGGRMPTSKPKSVSTSRPWRTPGPSCSASAPVATHKESQRTALGCRHLFFSRGCRSWPGSWWSPSTSCFRPESSTWSWTWASRREGRAGSRAQGQRIGGLPQKAKTAPALWEHARSSNLAPVGVLISVTRHSTEPWGHSETQSFCSWPWVGSGKRTRAMALQRHEDDLFADLPKLNYKAPAILWGQSGSALWCIVSTFLAMSGLVWYDVMWDLLINKRKGLRVVDLSVRECPAWRPRPS